MDTDQARQNVGPDMCPNCLTLKFDGISEIILSKKSAEDNEKKLQKIPSKQSINTDYNVMCDTTPRLEFAGSDCNDHALKSLFSEDDYCFFQGSVISVSSNKGNIKTNKLLSAESIQVIISSPASAFC